MKKIKIDENGLIEGVDYKRKEDGFIDWRAMVDEKYLVPNASFFEMKKLPLPKSYEEIPEEFKNEDKALLILLGGIKDLARLRGYKSVEYTPVHFSEHQVTVKCRIVWRGNEETNGEDIVFEDMSNASYYNCISFTRKYYESIACNRAFVRCVRNFLGIYIVGKDEIDGNPNEQIEGPKTPSNSYEQKSVSLNKDDKIKMLKNKLFKVKIKNLEEFKNKLINAEKAEVVKLIDSHEGLREKMQKDLINNYKDFPEEFISEIIKLF